MPQAVSQEPSRRPRVGKKESSVRYDGQEGKRPPALPLGLGAQESSHCLVPAREKDTENPEPGTLASFYRVRHRERGNNTLKRKQSSLGTVVLLHTAGKQVETLRGTPRKHCGSCSPPSNQSTGKWQISGRGFPVQLESWEETSGKKRSPGKKQKYEKLWEL